MPPAQVWEAVDSAAVEFRQSVTHVSGEVRSKLRSLDEKTLLALLRHRPSGRTVLFAGAHLHWNPDFPHVKACQAEMMCQGAALMLRKHKMDAAAVPVVVCGDFNSVPHLQPVSGRTAQPRQRPLLHGLVSLARSLCLPALADHPSCHCLTLAVRRASCQRSSARPSPPSPARTPTAPWSRC